jgi:hypothetical protein
METESEINIESIYSRNKNKNRRLIQTITEGKSRDKH